MARNLTEQGINFYWMALSNYQRRISWPRIAELDDSEGQEFASRKAKEFASRTVRQLLEQ